MCNTHCLCIWDTLLVLISEQIGRKYWGGWSYYASLCNILFSREDFWRDCSRVYIDMKHNVSLCKTVCKRKWVQIFQEISVPYNWCWYWYSTTVGLRRSDTTNFVQLGSGCRFLRRLESQYIIDVDIGIDYWHLPRSIDTTSAKFCTGGSQCSWFLRRFHILSGRTRWLSKRWGNTCVPCFWDSSMSALCTLHTVRLYLQNIHMYYNVWLHYYSTVISRPLCHYISSVFCNLRQRRLEWMHRRREYSIFVLSTIALALVVCSSTSTVKQFSQ